MLVVETPPEVAHAPIEITPFRFGHLLVELFDHGAIFCDTRPAMIIRSAWRGEDEIPPTERADVEGAAIDIHFNRATGQTKSKAPNRLLRAQLRPYRAA